MQLTHEDSEREGVAQSYMASYSASTKTEVSLTLKPTLFSRKFLSELSEGCDSRYSGKDQAAIRFILMNGESFFISSFHWLSTSYNKSFFNSTQFCLVNVS